MSARLLILLRKELAQNWLIVLGLAFLMALVGLGNWGIVYEDPLATSQLAALSKTAVGFTPIAGLILGHYLVVREYHGRAQLFLETLPLSRWEFVVAKLAFGYAVLAALTIALLLVIANVTGEADARHQVIMGARLLGYTAALWSVLFAFGLLGRLRLPLYVAVFISLFVLQRTSDFEIERFAPLALVDSTLAYERERFPARELALTALLSAAFVAISLGLSLIREGSVAEVLARRASQREKSAFVVFLAMAMLVAITATDKQEKKPFEFTSPYVKKSARSDVSVMYGWPDLEPSAAVVIAELERAASRFERELGFAKRPPIRVAHQSALGAREIREQYLPDTDGVLIETNLAPGNLDLAGLLYTSVHDSFQWKAGERATFEPDHWFLDGFSAWWVAEQFPEARDRLWLRGLAVAHSRSIDPALVASWERLMEAEGEVIADGVAFTAVAFLVERHGRARVLDFARAHLTAPAADGLFGFLRRSRAPLSRELTRLTQSSWAEFVAGWREELSRKSSRAPWSERLRQLPRMEAALRVEVGGSGTRISYELWGEAAAASRECALLHTAIAPFDVFVGSDQLQREPVTWREGETRVSGDLRGRYGSGQRVLLAVECYLPELGAPKRLRVLRATVP